MDKYTRTLVIASNESIIVSINSCKELTHIMVTSKQKVYFMNMPVITALFRIACL